MKLMDGFTKIKMLLNNKSKFVKTMLDKDVCPHEFGLDSDCNIDCDKCWEFALSNHYPQDNMNRRVD
jgi:hypothetical protein